MWSSLSINHRPLIVCNITNTKLLVLGLAEYREWKAHID